jgi:competence protein ComGC
MNANSNGRLRSLLGEHLIVLLVVAMVIIGSLVAVPSLMAQTKDTATQMQDRMNQPLTVAAELDATP